MRFPVQTNFIVFLSTLFISSYSLASLQEGDAILDFGNDIPVAINAIEPAVMNDEERRNLVMKTGRLVGLAETLGVPIQNPVNVLDANHDELMLYSERLSSIAHSHGFRADGRATVEAEIPGRADNIHRCGGSSWEVMRNVFLGLGGGVEIISLLSGVIYASDVLTGEAAEAFRIITLLAAPLGGAFLAAGAVANKQYQDRRTDAKRAADHYNITTLGLEPLYSIEVVEE